MVVEVMRVVRVLRVVYVQADGEGAGRRAEPGPVAGRQLASDRAVARRPVPAAPPVALLGHHARLRHSRHARRAQRRPRMPHRVRQGRRPPDDGRPPAAAAAAAARQTQFRLVLVRRNRVVIV